MLGLWSRRSENVLLYHTGDCRLRRDFDGELNIPWAISSSVTTNRTLYASLLSIHSKSAVYQGMNED